MKQLFLVAFFVCIAPVSILGQSAERQLIATTGGSFSNASFSTDYSVGETIISTLSTATVTLTQGFQQPPFEFVPVAEPDLTHFMVLYPNPGAGQYQLNLGKLSSAEVTVTVYDILGRQVYSRLLRDVESNGIIDLDFTHLATGEYHLRLTDSGTSQMVPFIKVSK